MLGTAVMAASNRLLASTRDMRSFCAPLPPPKDVSRTNSEALDAIARNVGAPRDVLTARLRRLVEAGVLTRHQYSEHPPRFEYRLTAAGRELRPVLPTLMHRGDRHLADAPAVVFEHSCGAEPEPVVVCGACRHEVGGGELSARFLDPHWGPAGLDPEARTGANP
jgi:DNA-binding HxlR family transcriptional regulator